MTKEPESSHTEPLTPKEIAIQNARLLGYKHEMGNMLLLPDTKIRLTLLFEDKEIEGAYLDGRIQAKREKSENE